MQIMGRVLPGGRYRDSLDKGERREFEEIYRFTS